MVRGGSWEQHTRERALRLPQQQPSRQPQQQKARKVCSATRHLGDRFDAYRAGGIGFGELDASVKGSVNHVRSADTWGLRRHLFTRLRVGAAPRRPTSEGQV